MVEHWWPSSSLWNSKGEAFWITWGFFYGTMPFLWNWVRFRLFMQHAILCYYACSHIHVYSLNFFLLYVVFLVTLWWLLISLFLWIDPWRYMRDFEIETIGLKETARRCSKVGCGARLKDTVLDWEVTINSFLFNNKVLGWRIWASLYSCTVTFHGPLVVTVKDIDRSLTGCTLMSIQWLRKSCNSFNVFFFVICYFGQRIKDFLWLKYDSTYHSVVDLIHSPPVFLLRMLYLQRRWIQLRDTAKWLMLCYV